MEKHVRIGLLMDYYGTLLTPAQRETIEWHYAQDLSLFEIAQARDITRQAVRDHLVRAEAQLEHYEAQLHLMEKAMLTQEIGEKLRACVEGNAAAIEQLNALMALWGENDGI